MGDISTTAEKAIEILENAEHLNAFRLAAQEGEHISITTDEHSQKEDRDHVALLGIQILDLASQLGVHPQDVGQKATEWAVRQEASDNLHVTENLEE